MGVRSQPTSLSTGRCRSTKAYSAESTSLRTRLGVIRMRLVGLNARPVTLVCMTSARPTIREVLAAGEPTFSFEFFPPKTEQGARNLWQAIPRLEVLQPTFVSVTYGAGGGTRDRTVEIVERIATDTTLTPVAHFTAVNHSIRELRQLIGRFAAAGGRDLLALRGGPPGGPMGTGGRHPHGVEYAQDVGPLLKEPGDLSRGGAAF